MGGIGSGFFVNQPKFGIAPYGRRLERVLSSPNWNGRKFENYEPFGNPMAVDSKAASRIKAIAEFVFPTKGKMFPEQDVSVVNTDLKSLSPQDNVVVWLGHSSIFIQQDGVRILIDPVLSGYASPLPFLVRSFPGQCFIPLRIFQILICSLFLMTTGIIWIILQSPIYCLRKSRWSVPWVWMGIL